MIPTCWSVSPYVTICSTFTNANAVLKVQTVQAAVFCNTLELSESYKLCIHLLTRIPPVSHPDEITLIHTTIFNLEEQGLVFNTRDVEKLWENAIKVQETLEQQADLTREWLKRSIYCRQWQLAQKVCLATYEKQLDILH